MPIDRDGRAVRLTPPAPQHPPPHMFMSHIGDIKRISFLHHFYPDLWIKDPDLDTVVQLST